MIEKGKFWLVFVAVLVVLLLLSSCVTIVTSPTATVVPASQQELTPTKSRSVAELPKGKPADYFPTKTGTGWTYEIRIGEAEPLIYRETIWPVGEKAIISASRGRFLVLLAEDRPETFTLDLRVKGPASEQGVLKYPNGVELEILKDELGVYEGASQVFWAPTSSGGFLVEEVVTYPPNSPGAPTGAWGSWGQKDGSSLRIIFFSEAPGTSISRGKEPKEELRFVGLDINLKGFAGQPLLHFQRVVKPDDEPSELGKGFIEDTWFAQGKGMVKLVQKVEGLVSMTWTLVE